MNIQRNGQSVVGFALGDDDLKMRMSTPGGALVGGFMAVVGGFVGYVGALVVGAASSHGEPKRFFYLVPAGMVAGAAVGSAITAARQRPV